MRVGAAGVLVHWLCLGHRCVYVMMGTCTAMKELVLMTTFLVYSTHGRIHTIDLSRANGPVHLHALTHNFS